MHNSENYRKKLGYRTCCIYGKSAEESLKLIAGAGYAAAELCLESFETDEVLKGMVDTEVIKAILYDHQINLSSVSFHTKRTGWAKRRAVCIEGLKIAKELGVDIFVSGIGIETDNEDFNQTVRFCRELCKLAEDYNIDFAVEPEPGTTIPDSDSMRKLLREVDAPNLKLNLDIGHAFLTEKDVPGSIHYWGNKIVHTHIEDIQKNIHLHLMPGEGEINFRKVFKAFFEIDYSGYYIFDLPVIENSPAEFIQSAAVKLIKEVESVSIQE